MADDPMIIYLQDHLTGANFAVGLLETWHRNHKETSLGIFAEQLRLEIESDRGELRQLIEFLGGTPNPPRSAVGWFAEKVNRVKFNSKAEVSADIFEGMEVLALGILGKLALWDVLKALARADARLARLDFNRLAVRAKEQHGRVERRRIELASAIFTPPLTQVKPA